MSKKIVSIEIELKNYEPIKFTMDEAKELYEQLHSIFGEKEWYRPYYTWYNASRSISDASNLISTTDSTWTVASNNTGMKVNYLSETANG